MQDVQLSSCIIEPFHCQTSSISDVDKDKKTLNDGIHVLKFWKLKPVAKQLVTMYVIWA